MNASELPILSIMLAVPMLAAIACLFSRAELARVIALTATLFNLLLGASTLVGLEAALTFTGLGMPSRTPSWGGGLGALAQGGHGGALAVVVIASIGSTCAALYGLAASLERRQRRAPGFPPRLEAAPPDLGAEGQGG